MAQKSIPIFVMGKRYDVPEGLTILKAMEYAGYSFVRGCGCRSGFCGACATVYRVSDEPRLKVALACQTSVRPNMYLAQIPSFPVLRADYEMAEVSDAAAELLELYPEVLHCLGCNTCGRACPQDLDVKGYVAALQRGELERATELSFDCLMCGLCAARCPVGIAPYMAALFARRAYGKLLAPRDEKYLEMVRRVQAGEYEGEIGKLMKLDESSLGELYREREFESIAADS